MSEVRCGRCGEANAAGSVFCATCGLGLEAGDGESPPDATSQAVAAPQFGETGLPVVTGPSSSAPPTESVPTPAYGVTVPNAAAGTSEFVTAPPSGSGRSTSLMIAALVVATVVIVGGALIVVLSGGDGQETGDMVASPETTTLSSSAPSSSETSLTTEDSTTSIAEATTIATTIAAVEPIVTVASTLPPPTAAPSTVPPPPLPTAAPPSVAAPPPPIRGPGDLGLPQPILDEACDGRYITFVGSAVGDRPYGDVVQELLDTYPGANYIWTKSCPSLRQVFRDGSDIYGVVFGPYATVGEACSARGAGPPDAYVRRISQTDPQDHTVDC